MVLEAVPEVGSAAPAGSVGVAGRRPGGQDPSGGAATLRKLPALLLAQAVTQCGKRVWPKGFGWAGGGFREAAPEAAPAAPAGSVGCAPTARAHPAA